MALGASTNWNNEAHSYDSRVASDSRLRTHSLLPTVLSFELKTFWFSSIKKHNESCSVCCSVKSVHFIKIYSCILKSNSNANLYIYKLACFLPIIWRLLLSRAKWMYVKELDNIIQVSIKAFFFSLEVPILN